MFIIKLCQWQNWNWKPLSTEPQPLPIKTIFVATKCDPHDYFRRLQVAKALTNPIHRENILWIARARGTTFSFEVSLENWSKLWEAICFFHFMLLLFFIWLFHRDRGYFRHRDPTFSFCLFWQLHLALTFHKMHRIYFYFDGPNLIHWLAARYTFLYTVVKSLPWSQ